MTYELSRIVYVLLGLGSRWAAVVYLYLQSLDNWKSGTCYLLSCALAWPAPCAVGLGVGAGSAARRGCVGKREADAKGAKAMLIAFAAWMIVAASAAPVLTYRFPRK